MHLSDILLIIVNRGLMRITVISLEIQMDFFHRHRIIGMYIHTPHPIQIHRHGQRTSLRHQISIDQGVFTDKFYIGRDLIDRLLYIEISPEKPGIHRFRTGIPHRKMMRIRLFQSRISLRYL